MRVEKKKLFSHNGSREAKRIVGRQGTNQLLLEDGIHELQQTRPIDYDMMLKMKDKEKSALKSLTCSERRSEIQKSEGAQNSGSQT